MTISNRNKNHGSPARDLPRDLGVNLAITPKINRHICGSSAPRSAAFADHESQVTTHSLSVRQNGSSGTSALNAGHFLSRYNRNVPIKLIAMDIDGTLLDSASRLSDDKSRTIAEAAARGIEILLVTGRRFHSARLIADMLPCELGFIVNNGSLLKSKDGVTQQRHLLPSGTARRVLEQTPEFRSCAAVVFDRPRENQVILEQVDFDDPFRGGYFRRSREYIAQVSPLTTGVPAYSSISRSFQLSPMAITSSQTSSTRRKILTRERIT